MWFKNLTGEDILLEAIHLNMLYTGKRLPAQLVSNTTPSIRNIHFENITCLSGKSYMIELLGLPEMLIEDIWFDGIDAKTAKGINISDVRGIRFKNSNFSAMTVPLFTITDGHNISVDSVKFYGVVEQFLRIEGGNSNNIKISKSNIPSTDKSVLLGTDVSKQAVIIKD
jgi:hypothetical protein